MVVIVAPSSPALVAKRFDEYDASIRKNVLIVKAARGALEWPSRS
jgi:hypothetical protein